MDEMANVKEFIERQPFGGTSYVGIPMWENERGVREVCKHAIPNQGHDLICNATSPARPTPETPVGISIFSALSLCTRIDAISGEIWDRPQDGREANGEPRP